MGKIKKKISLLLAAILMLSSMPAMAKEESISAENATVTYTIKHMYATDQTVTVMDFGQGHLDKFIEYDGTMNGQTVEDPYENEVIVKNSGETASVKKNEKLIAAFENEHSGYTLNASETSSSTETDTDTTAVLNVIYTWKTKSTPSNTAGVKVNHNFKVAESDTETTINGGREYTYTETVYDTVGTTKQIEYCTNKIKTMEEAGLIVTKPTKQTVTFGTDAEITYHYTVSQGGGEGPQEDPKVTYTVKHLYPKNTSITSNVSDDDFIVYDGTVGGETVENGYTAEKKEVKSGEEFKPSANQKLISAWEKKNKGFTLNASAQSRTMTVTEDTEAEILVYYLSVNNKKTVTVTHTFKAVRPFLLNNQQVTEVTFTKHLTGVNGDTEDMPYDDEHIAQFESIGYTVTKPAVQKATYGQSAEVAYVYTMKHPDDSQYGGGSSSSSTSSSTTASSTTTQQTTTSVTYKNDYNMTDQQAQVAISALQNGNQEVSLSIGSVKFGVAKDEDGAIAITSVTGSGSVVIPDTIKFGNYEYPVTNISAGVFANNAGITSITFGKNITNIGEKAFLGCVSLKEVKFNDGLVTIGKGAFKNCSSLESLIMPISLTEIGSNAFENCTSLKKLVLNNGLLEIGNSAFKNCKSLPSVTIPKTVLKIGNSAFEKCTKLKTLKFSSGCELLTIGKKAFANCTSLKKVALPNELETLSAMAFYNCKKLTSVTGGKELNKIGDKAFMNCVKLPKFTVGKMVMEIGKQAFYGCKKLKKVTINSKVLTKVGSKAFKKAHKQIIFLVPNEQKVEEYGKLLKGKY